MKLGQPILGVAALGVALLGCGSSTSTDEVRREPTATAAPAPTPLPIGKRRLRPHLQAPEDRPADPKGGRFTLEDAIAGLPGAGELRARVETDLGVLECRLFQDEAPVTVANFVGLARGTRPFWDGGAWVSRPAFDGTLFHRISKGFMIQGGSKTGADEAGYAIRDEVWGAHDRAGLLCMANRGKDTGSRQFFITDGPAPHLDGGFTIFGECGPLELIGRLASVPVRGEAPISPPVIRSVRIERGAAGAEPSASSSSRSTSSAAPRSSAAPSAKARASAAPSAP